VDSYTPTFDKVHDIRFVAALKKNRARACPAKMQQIAHSICRVIVQQLKKWSSVANKKR